MVILKLHSFHNFLKDALRNITLNKILTLATVITLAAGLFLFGFATAITLNVFSITDKLENDFKIAVYIDEKYPSENISRIKDEIAKLPNISEITFVPKDQAFEDFKAAFGETDILEGIDNGSILRDSYQLTLTDLSLARQLVPELQKIDGIVKVVAMDDKMDTFLNVTKKLQMGTIIVSLILGLLSVLIITNTINLSIFNRRKQINIMKYVGATDWYIRWPFVIEGAVIGLIAAVISFAGVYFLYDAIIGTTAGFNNTLGLVDKQQMVLPILLVIFSAGILLGVLGSLISVRKHLKV